VRALAQVVRALAQVVRKPSKSYWKCSNKHQQVYFVYVFENAGLWSMGSACSQPANVVVCSPLISCMLVNLHKVLWNCVGFLKVWVHLFTGCGCSSTGLKLPQVLHRNNNIVVCMLFVLIIFFYKLLAPPVSLPGAEFLHELPLLPFPGFTSTT